MSVQDTEDARSVPRVLDTMAGWSWRLVIVAIAIWLLLSVLVEIKLVIIPLVAALILTTVLVPAAQTLTRRGIPHLLATWLVMLGFIGIFVGVVALLAPAAADQSADLDETLESAVDEIEQWLVTGPFGLDPETVVEWRENAYDTIESFFEQEGAIAEGAVLVGEAVAGIVLALVITFFLVKDGAKLLTAVLGWFPPESRPRALAAGEAAWRTLGGYVRGSALLGLIEGVVIGIAMAAVGAELVLPVVALTFLAAFFPFVGAIVAGVLAVLVTLVSAGLTEAAIVAGVALVVQQFDGDLLAPLIFGRYLRLHPVVIIVVLAAGGIAGGLSGAFLAVPVTAVVINVIGAVRRYPDGDDPPPDGPDADAPGADVPDADVPDADVPT